MDSPAAFNKKLMMAVAQDVFFFFVGQNRTEATRSARLSQALAHSESRWHDAWWRMVHARVRRRHPSAIFGRGRQRCARDTMMLAREEVPFSSPRSSPVLRRLGVDDDYTSQQSNGRRRRRRREERREKMMDRRRKREEGERRT